MQEDETTPVDASAVRVFRTVRPRSHTTWATLGMFAYWGGLFLLLGPLKAPESAFLTGLWFVWQFIGIVALPYAARRIDDALASRRGDHRPLRRPYVSALGAFLGSAALFPLLIALSAWGLRLSDIGGDAVILPTMAVGGWLGAWLGSLGAPERTVSVGFDALTCARGRRSTVVALRDITAVHSTTQEVYVHRREGPALTIDLRGLGVECVALGAAIERAARAAQERVPVGAALRREDLALDAWRESLHAKALGGTDFRAQALDRDDLEAALVHPGATAEERIGAALALRALDDAGATRVRVAAEAALDPSLRDALRAVADDTLDDALVREATRARG